MTATRTKDPAEETAVRRKPRQRKLKLAYLATFLNALAALAALRWPGHKEAFVHLATALNALFAFVAAAMGYEDGQEARARAQIAAAQAAPKEGDGR